MHLLLKAALAITAAQGVADHPSGAADGFYAVQAVTSDPQAFVRDWDRPGAHVDLQVTHDWVRGRPITVFILFRGCRSVIGGACHVRARVEVIAPDGKPTPLKADFRVWDKAPLQRPLMARSEQAPTLSLPDDAPLGRYVLRTTVADETDQALPKVVRLETSVIVRAAQ